MQGLVYESTLPSLTLILSSSLIQALIVLVAAAVALAVLVIVLALLCNAERTLELSDGLDIVGPDNASLSLFHAVCPSMLFP